MKTTLTRDTDFRTITVDEAKLWLRIDTDADDTLIDGLILAATSAAEAFLGRSITPATIELAYRGGLYAYPLNYGPVIEVVGVELEDRAGTRTTLDVDDFRVVAADLGDTVVLKSARSCFLSVIVTAEAGYVSADDVPQLIKQAIAVHVGSAYAGREGQDTAQATFENLLRPFGVGGF